MPLCCVQSLSTLFAWVILELERDLMSSLNHPPLRNASHFNLHSQSCDHLHDGIGAIHFSPSDAPSLLPSPLDEALQLRSPHLQGTIGEKINEGII